MIHKYPRWAEVVNYNIKKKKQLQESKPPKAYNGGGSKV
jgi:hypothetical protein